MQIVTFQDHLAQIDCSLLYQAVNRYREHIQNLPVNDPKRRELGIKLLEVKNRLESYHE